MLEASWTGRRVSVRRVLGIRPDGRRSFGDVVGDLVHLDGAHALIDSRTGVVEVPIDTVVLARLAPPSTADELALEAVVAAGWRPAEQEQLGGWTLRASGGFTGRGNSVLPLRQLDRSLDDALDAARAWYAARGLPVILQVPMEARRLLDAELGERGWPGTDRTHVMVRRLDELPGAAGTGARGDAGDIEVAVATAPDDEWMGVFRGGSARDWPDARALLARHDDVQFVSVRRGDATVAVGRGAVDDGWLGITAVEVAPQARRQGLARRVVAELTAWGRARGAARGHLEVAVDNTAAVVLYESLGYWPHHDYQYRREPAA